MIQNVSPRIHVETGHLGSNNGVIVGDDGQVLLVDAPHKPTDAIAWAETVRDIGDLGYVVHTDHHPDHTIGNAFVGGVVVAHDVTRRRLEHEPQERAYLQRLFADIDPAANDDERSFTPRLPTITFSDRMTIHVGGLRVDLHHVPGHTENTIAVHVPGEGVVFTGDNVCPQGLPSFQDSTLTRWFDALDEIERLDFEVLVGGHGEISGRGAIEDYRRKGRAVVREVAAGMARGMSRDELIATVRFEDRVHVSTDDYVGYPQDICEVFQVRSIARIHDDLIANPGLATR